MNAVTNLLTNPSRTLFLILVTALLLLSGCGSLIRVDADYRPEFDFNQLQSYAWLDPASPPSADIRIDNDLYKERVVAAVESVLAAKGLIKAEDGPPDFLVTWFGAIDKKMRAETINYFYSRYWGGSYSDLYGPWGGGFSSTRVYEYEVGTLIIDFVTPEQKRLFWRGTGQSYVEQGRSPRELTESVAKTVAAILAQFPPLPESND
jgi:hypothetical protein